jgi:hypothetical protein
VNEDFEMSRQSSELPKLLNRAISSTGMPEGKAMPAPFPPSDPHLYDNSASYITRYSPEFKKNFDTGTAIMWDILFSNSIGGNFDPATEDLIYVTAWNRASFGCEALISYYRSDAPALAVYDHVPDVFTFTQATNSTTLAPFVTTRTVDGITLNAITVVNMTYEEGDGWMNEVHVLSPDQKHALTIYSTPKPRPLTSADQKTSEPFDGSYGPTIEPSRGLLDPFSGTAPLGWANVNLKNRDVRGAWGDWQLLTPEQSSIEPGIGGFTVRSSQPNYSAILST